MGLEKTLGPKLAAEVEQHRQAVINEMEGNEPAPAEQTPKKDGFIENLGGGLTRDIELGKKMVAKDIGGPTADERK